MAFHDKTTLYLYKQFIKCLELNYFTLVYIHNIIHNMPVKAYIIDNVYKSKLSPFCNHGQSP